MFKHQEMWLASLSRLFLDIKRQCKEVIKLVRADSGFAIAKLFELLEENSTLYVMRAKAYKELYTLAKEITEGMDYLVSKNSFDYKVTYGEVFYKAKSCTESRRVVVKIEKLEGQIGYNYTFVIINKKSSSKDVIKFYSNKGAMENFIKESKNGFVLIL